MSSATFSGSSAVSGLQTRKDDVSLLVAMLRTLSRVSTAGPCDPLSDGGRSTFPNGGVLSGATVASAEDAGAGGTTAVVAARSSRSSTVSLKLGGSLRRKRVTMRPLPLTSRSPRSSHPYLRRSS